MNLMEVIRDKSIKFGLRQAPEKNREILMRFRFLKTLKLKVWVGFQQMHISGPGPIYSVKL